MLTLWVASPKRAVLPEGYKFFENLPYKLKPNENVPGIRERASCQNHDYHKKR